MRTTGLISVVIAGMALAACEGAGQKQTAGTVLGGIGGAVAGAQFGSGSGQLATTAIGTLLGAYLGSEIGSSLDRADQAMVAQAEQAAHAAPVGERIVWNNPESGHSGSVTPIRDGTDSQSGQYCREYHSTVTIGGKTEDAFGTACQQPDGSWKIVN